jgi:hypothetical protein
MVLRSKMLPLRILRGRLAEDLALRSAVCGLGVARAASGEGEGVVYGYLMLFDYLQLRALD